MGTLLIRLAGPAQSWAGYRVSYTKTGTFPIPTKSGVAGFLGACLGVKDYLSLLDDFDLHVRVDKTNPFVTDLQVASGVKKTEEANWLRTITLAQGEPPKGLKRADKKKSDGLYTLTGTALHSLSNRDFIPHAEFICALETTDEQAHAWNTLMRRPVYMPYLGRRANAPSFPVLLGWAPENPTDLLTRLPRVPRHDEPTTDTPEPVRAYHVTGNYHHTQHTLYTLIPPTTDRKDQLTWASTHLNR